MPTTGQLWPPGAAITVAAPAAASIVGQTYLNQGGAGATTIASVLPSGLVTGDRLFLVMMSSDTQAGAAVTESTAGWTVATATADVGTMRRAMYTATWTAGLAAPSWTLAAARKGGFMCVAIRNADPTPKFGNSDGGAFDSVAPVITPAPLGVWLRFYIRKDNLSASVTPPAGGTLLTGALGGGTGPSAHLLCYTQTPAGTPMPTATATFPVTSVNSTAWSVAA